MSPLFYQPEPDGAIESAAFDALIAAGFALRTRYGIITGSDHGYKRAARGAYRTRTHRTFRALLYQAQEDGQL